MALICGTAIFAEIPIKLVIIAKGIKRVPPIINPPRASFKVLAPKAIPKLGADTIIDSAEPNTHPKTVNRFGCRKLKYVLGNASAITPKPPTFFIEATNTTIMPMYISPFAPLPLPITVSLTIFQNRYGGDVNISKSKPAILSTRLSLL